MVKHRRHYSILCILAVGLSACQTELPETQPRVRTQEDYCPDCLKLPWHTAMTWVTRDAKSVPVPESLPHMGIAFSVVGADDHTNATMGDTSVIQSLPLLCRRTLDSPIALNDGSTINDELNVTAAVQGDTLKSRRVADELCETTFGGDWQMLEVPASSNPQRLIGLGALPAGIRFWVAHPSAPVNPWID